MDWIACKNTGISLFRKYRYALLAVLVGSVLLMLPETKTVTVEKLPSTETQDAPADLERSLADILSMIDGAGKVEVLLTQARGEETVYQTDENISSGERSADRRADTVLITGEGRLETGLVRQVNPPTYLGALVVCQGASDPKVRLALVEAVMRVTGLRSDKITVLKMK